MTSSEQLFVEFVLSSLISITGLCFQRIFLSQLSLAQRALLSFPVGAACFVLLSLPIVVVFGRAEPVVLLLACFLALFFTWKKFGRLDRRDFSVVIALSFLLSALACYARYLCLTYDSYGFIYISRALHVTGGVQDVIHKLSSYPIFISVIHNSAQFAGAELSIALNWFMGFVGFAAIVFLIPVKRSPFFYFLSTIAGLFVFSNFLTFFSLFYVNGHTIFGTYLCLALLSLWRMKYRKEQEYWPLFLLSVASLCFLRLEGMIVAAIVLSMFIASDDISREVKIKVCGITAAYCWLWYLYALAPSDDDSITSPTTVITMLVGVTGPFVYVLIKKLEFFNSFVMPIITAALLSGSIAGLLVVSDSVGTSIVNTIANMGLYGMWGAGWATAFAILALASKLQKFEGQQDFVFFILSFFLLLIVLAFARHSLPYRWGFGDSANRMLIHLLPVCCMFVLMRIFLTRDDEV